MSVAAILGAIAALGTIVGGVIWIVKRVDWSVSSTPEQEKEGIDQDVDQRENQTEQEGRPH